MLSLDSEDLRFVALKAVISSYGKTAIDATGTIKRFTAKDDLLQQAISSVKNTNCVFYFAHDRMEPSLREEFVMAANASFPTADYMLLYHALNNTFSTQFHNVQQAVEITLNGKFIDLVCDKCSKLSLQDSIRCETCNETVCVTCQKRSESLCPSCPGKANSY